MNEVVLTDANFGQEVLHFKGSAMVDFFAPWCGPCKMMAPAVEKLAEEYKGKVKIGKFDVDENPEVAGKYEIQSIPTIIFFKDGNMADKMVGFQSGEALKQKLDVL